ncbi:MAG: outer membrane beta-barrel protein [Candidatus Aminicenantales bacterium]
MKKSIFRLAVCGVIVLALTSAPANAQFYLGVRGGLSNQNAKAGELEFDRNSAVLYGAQAGIKFLGLTVEGQFYRADHNLLGENAAMVEVEQEMDYYYLGVSGKLGISLAIVYPYVTVGYGTYSIDLKDLGKKSDGAFNVGAGAEVTLGKIGIFGELRYTDFSVEIESLKWDFGGLDLHFGLNIHF